MKILLPATADRETWLAARRYGVGASEAAAVIGQSQWDTALSLYLRKVGEMPDILPSERMVWGIRLQDSIAAGYAEDYGREVWRGPALCASERFPWMLASPDVLAADRLVEVKNLSRESAKDFGPEGSDQVAPYIYFQAQQQMEVCNYQLCDIAGLVAGQELRVWTIERNEGVIERLAYEEKLFMERVARRDPPMPDFDHETTYDLLRREDVAEGSCVTLDHAAMAAATRLESVQRRGKVIEAGIRQIKAKLIFALDKCELGFLPDGRTVKRKGERFWIKRPKARF